MQILENERGIALSIPRDTHKQLRLYAAEHDTSIAAIVREAIQRFLAEQPKVKAS